MNRRDLSVVLANNTPICHHIPEFKPHASRILKQLKINRIPFDASNSDHRLAYAVFIETGRWSVQFEIEPPDLNVVKTIQRKLIEYAISQETAKAQAIAKNIQKADKLVEH